MKIILNLATRPYADQGPALKRLRIGMAVLALVLAGLGFALMQIHQAALKMTAQEDAVDRSITRIEGEEQGYRAQMLRPENARVLKQAQFLNGLFDEKAFSWTAAMEDLERVLPAGVQVTAIEPSRNKDGRITLHLRISGPRERSVEMLRNMEHSRRFTSPRISGENAENNVQGNLQPVIDTGNGKVSFDVLSEYNPATPEERKAAIAASKRGSGGARAGAVQAPLIQPGRPGVLRQPYIRPQSPMNPGMPGMPGRNPNRPNVPVGIPGQPQGVQQ